MRSGDRKVSKVGAEARNGGGYLLNFFRGGRVSVRLNIYTDGGLSAVAGSYMRRRGRMTVILCSFDRGSWLGLRVK